MPDKSFNVLFICRQNSARSQMAETLLNFLGKPRLRAFSAGLEPAGELHPLTLETIRNSGLSARDLRPKGLEAFAGPEAPRMDFVFLICEEADPDLSALPGHPMVAHWPIPDPNEVQGSHAEMSAAFAETFAMIRRRVELFVELPVTGLDHLTLQQHVNNIGAA
jgi:arsenate reductase (thioredoxin)